MKGYKVFEPDWTCRGFQYEVGKTYTHEGEIRLCEGGFHFCKELVDCFNYYGFNPKNKVARVVANGSVVEGETKCVTDKITIGEELDWHQVLDMVNLHSDNEGYGNVGRNNVGNLNVGDNNTGSWNTGDYNYGTKNVGSHNCGDYNSGTANRGFCNGGDLNIGNWNIGSGNVGDRNMGNRNRGNDNYGFSNNGNYNIGYFNITDGAYGIFNTQPRKMTMFNKETDLTFRDFEGQRVYGALLYLSQLMTKWTYLKDITESEKSDIPESKILDGYLELNTDYKKDTKDAWDSLPHSDKKLILNLPNFDADIFLEITGIDVRGE